MNNLRMLRREKFAFTLIELLIVIAIIAILATLAMVQLGSARLKARDSRRKSDLVQVRIVLETYRNDQKKETVPYVSRNPVDFYSTNVLPGGGLKNFLIDKGYIKELPKDPSIGTGSPGSGTSNYLYETWQKGVGPGTIDAYDFVLYGLLENTKDQDLKTGNPTHGKGNGSWYWKDDNSQKPQINSKDANYWVTNQ